jgi:hypothetical protein
VGSAAFGWSIHDAKFPSRLKDQYGEPERGGGSEWEPVRTQKWQGSRYVKLKARSANLVLILDILLVWLGYTFYMIGVILDILDVISLKGTKTLLEQRQIKSSHGFKLSR